MAQNTTNRKSAIKPAPAQAGGRTTRHPGYEISQRLRKRIEEPFGWLKTVGGRRKTRDKGMARTGWAFTLAMAAYNLLRLPKLIGAAA